eukprot:sb/3462596/
MSSERLKRKDGLSKRKVPLSKRKVVYPKERWFIQKKGLLIQKKGLLIQKKGGLSKRKSPYPQERSPEPKGVRTEGSRLCRLYPGGMRLGSSYGGFQAMPSIPGWYETWYAPKNMLYVLIGIMLLCFLVNFVILPTTTTLGSVSERVGTSYNIGKVQIDDEIPSGKRIFTKLDGSCLSSVEHITTDKNVKVYTNQEEFIHEFAVGVGLTAKELGGKGDLTASYLKKSSTETAGTLIEVKFTRQRERHRLLTEVLRLNHGLEDRDLGSLPYPITKPHIRHAWLPTMTSNESKMSLKLKLCAKFPDLNLDGCVDKSPKKSSKSETSDETNDVSVVGGSRETQDQLRRGEFTPALLDQLSREAGDHPSPVEHHWVSLPELLLSRLAFTTTVSPDLSNRAEALLSYYKGYHIFGCDHQVIGGRNITVFLNLGTDDYPQFECHQVPPGCQTDSDCRNWPLKFLGPCYCSGESCLTAKVQGIRKQSSNELVVQRGTVGAFSDEVNSRCTYSPTRGCSCTPASLTEVWPLGSIVLRSTKPASTIRWVLVLGVVVVLVVLVGVLVVVVRKGKSLSDCSDKDSKSYGHIENKCALSPVNFGSSWIDMFLGCQLSHRGKGPVLRHFQVSFSGAQGAETRFLSPRGLSLTQAPGWLPGVWDGGLLYINYVMQDCLLGVAPVNASALLPVSDIRICFLLSGFLGVSNKEVVCGWD